MMTRRDIRSRPSCSNASEPPAAYVLVVDDDEGFQQTVTFALEDYRSPYGPIELLYASTAADAMQLLVQRPDIALVLLDVVMESDDAGLQLVRKIREQLGYEELRIVLVTGQPGIAPVNDVMISFDINDYLAKEELSSSRLRTTVTASLRAHRQLMQISQARRGLRNMLEASTALNTLRSISQFAPAAIAEVAALISVPPHGVMASSSGPGATDPDVVLGATGRYVALMQSDNALVTDRDAYLACRQSLRSKTMCQTSAGVAMFLEGNEQVPDHVCFVALQRPLDVTETDLLKLLAAHLGSMVRNITLMEGLDAVAYQDPQLQLPNRTALLRALEKQLALDPQSTALLLVDLDAFSETNLTLGLEHGDALLRACRNRLQKAFPPPSILARLHDDLFAVLGPADQVAAESCQSALNPPGGGQAQISASSARVLLSECAGDASRTLAVASLMLKNAKAQGFGQHMDHDPRIELRSASRHELAVQLHTAVVRNHIQIHLQPQVAIDSTSPIGFEALARWTLPNGQVVSPGEFIPIAESTGDIVELGQLVLLRACEAWKLLPPSLRNGLRVAVNMSSRQFHAPDYLTRVQRVLDQVGIAGMALQIEITESVAMRELDLLTEQLLAFRALGIETAIDDFGTGYSSLSCLRRLPVDWLKIDRSFISEIQSADAEATIAELILQLAGKLGLRTIAEGVETPEQAAWLRKRGCHAAQGFLFARPMPTPQLMAWLHQQPSLA